VSTLCTVSDDPICKALSELRSLGGVQSGYVRKAAEDVEALPFDREELEAWITEHRVRRDDREYPSSQLGGGVPARRHPKVVRSWLIPVDALNAR